MTVIKARHQKYSVSLSNAVLQDAGLSLPAIGLWAHCMSRPEGWTFYITELCKRFKIGKNSLHKLINELIQNGFAFRGQRKETSTDPRLGQKKVFSKMEYIFFGDRITPSEYLELAAEYALNKFQKIFQLPGIGEPQNEEPQTETLKGKDSSSLTEKKKTSKKEKREGEQARREARAAKAALSPDFLHFDLVHIKKKDHEALLNELGEEKLTQMIKELNRYAKIDPEEFKRYGCHASVIERWVENEKSQKKYQESVKTTHSKWWRNVLLKIGTRREIETTQDGVSFNYGTIYLLFKFTDSEFKLKTREQLRKMKLWNEEGE